jgi:LuxR family maltose regulon positive regulatory protein
MMAFPHKTNSSIWIRIYSEACLSRKNPGTIDVYQRVLRDFLLWCSQQPGHLSSHFDQLTRTTVEIYLTSLEEAGYSVSHRRRVKSVMSNFCQWLIDEHGLLTCNPTQGLAVPSPQGRAPRRLSDEQRSILQALVAQAEDLRGEALFALGYWAGCRVSDVAHLLREHTHVGPEIGWLHVGSKGGTFRTIDLLDQARRPLFAYLQHGERDPESIYVFPSQRNQRLSEAGIHHWFRALKQRANHEQLDKIADLSFHDLRHDFAQRVREAGWTQEEIASYLGHVTKKGTLALQTTANSTQVSREQVPGEPADVSSAQPAAARLPSPRIAITVDHSPSLLQTKLYRPRSRSDLIPRARLLERLNAGLSGNVTLISAPAGFGKTTLLAEWLETSDRPTAWLSLDENDNELRIFVHSLAAALRTVFPDALGATASLLKAPQFPPPDRMAPLLINDLADVPDDVILVLDDYHLIHNREIHTLLDQLIEHLPLQLHLVLISRSDPPLPLAKWLAQGRLNELRRTDLRFTLGETEAFLARMLGKEVAHETAMALEAWTDGWIAVLRLAALSLRSTSDRSAFMERLRHSPDRSVSRYLVEEILSRQAPFVQELLERMSLLEQFCAELCTAILGSDTSNAQVQATLDWLERSHALLVPLDEHQGWYRFHHLFQSLLQQHLQEHISTEEVATLHRRASAWYAAQGLIEQAIEHALAAGEVSGATSLVEAHVLWAFEQEQWVQMERWLGLLPEEQIQGSPWLIFARAWILQAHGQLQEHARLLTTAEQLLATIDSGTNDPHDLQSSLLRALIAILRSQIQYVTGQAQASLESARSALAWLPPDEAYVASHAVYFLALSNQAIGQEDIALLELNKALADHSTHLKSTARLLFAQAVVYLVAGKLHHLEQTSRHLLWLAQGADLALSHSWAHWLLGYVHYEWNQLDAAVYHFSAVLANQHQAHFWAVQEAMCGLALTYQAQGLGTRAQETARVLLEWVQERHNMHELRKAYAFCGQLALLQDEVEQASPWLELAGEQEVQGPMWFLEDPPITTAWMLLARGDESSVARGQALLTHLLQYVQTMHSTRKTINVLALQAWAYDLQGREIEALEVLGRALALARPGGLIRTFADLLPLANVLQELRTPRKTPQAGDKTLDAYLQRILAAMSHTAAHAESTAELLRQEGLEPLTDRELHILHLLDKDFTNKEIARELVVTTGTVKVHTSNVYRKLRVNNRRAAVTLAKALGLLEAG